MSMLLAALMLAGSPPAGAAPARPARLRSGWVSNHDYPPSARRRRTEGAAVVRYLIGREGEVESCEIVETSGDADLDAVSCRVVVDRFVFDPARDAGGARTTQTRTQRFVWTLPEQAASR